VVWVCGVWGQVVVPGTLGVAVSVLGNTQTTINYGVAPKLVITTSVDSNVTLDTFAAVGLLPQGYTSINFGADVGYTLSLSAGVVVSATLTTPALAASSVLAVNGSARVGVLEVNTAAITFYYQEVPITTYSATQGITLSLPEAGTYVFTAVDVNVAVPQFYTRAKQLVANVRSLVRYSANFVMDVTVDVNAKLNVTFYAVNPLATNPPAQYTSLNTYWDIQLDTTANVQATLQYTYTAAQLTGVGTTAGSLRFGYYDTTALQWNILSGAVIDTGATSVSQATTHFSTWGVFGSSGTPGTPPAPSGNGATGVVASILLLLACLSLLF